MRIRFSQALRCLSMTNVLKTVQDSTSICNLNRSKLEWSGRDVRGTVASISFRRRGGGDSKTVCRAHAGGWGWLWGVGRGDWEAEAG